MDERFSRNILYWGNVSQEKLSKAHVAVYGLGGVGGYCAEALARSGVGKLTLIDFDTISESNINRQIIALNANLGKTKTESLYYRLKDINPNLILEIDSGFYQDGLNLESVNYVADAIDTMRSKINLIVNCAKNGIPIISSMGAGNRIHPEKLYISDISEIHDKRAPFVSNVIYQLKKQGIESGVIVVASDEKPFVQEKISELEKVKINDTEFVEFNKIIPSSTPFVAPVAGIMMASKIVRDLIDWKI